MAILRTAVGRARASITVPGRIADAEALWYDLDRWPVFVDGFGRLVSAEGPWPGVGSVVTWDSRSGGRGRVREQVGAHEARAGQTLAVEDAKLRGTQAMTFESAGEQVRLTLIIEYELKERTAVTPVVDLFFVRRALTDSLKRTLVRFARERRSDIEGS